MSDFECIQEPFVTEKITMTHEQKWAYRKLQMMHKKMIGDKPSTTEKIKDLGLRISRRMQHFPTLIGDSLADIALLTI